MFLIRNRYFAPILLAAAMSASAFGGGCAARVSSGRYYDPGRRDYHTWDDREDRAYRQYLAEKHENYRDFSKQKKAEQNAYWNWRHSHPDSD